MGSGHAPEIVHTPQTSSQQRGHLARSHGFPSVCSRGGHPCWGVVHCSLSPTLRVGLGMLPPPESADGTFRTAEAHGGVCSI